MIILKMNKLIVVIMGPGKEHFAKMALESVKDADKIYYWSSNPQNVPIVKEPKQFVVFFNGWDESDPATNGKCRQRYLDYLKENHPDDWCLVIDEDEIVEDLDMVKKYIQSAKPGLYNMKMRHFIGNLGMEDATQQVHLVQHRLFKVSEAVKYPEHSHTILEGPFIANCVAGMIWHLGHLPFEYMKYIVKRYNQHSKDSIIHSPEFLRQWKNSHLLGQYPTKLINPTELPDIICREFEIDKDEFYFSRRQNLEIKHFIMIKNWLEILKENVVPINILDLGCGMGHYGYVATQFFPCGYKGYEISDFAVKNNPYTKLNLDIVKKDIVKERFEEKHYDLVLCIDVLEHLDYDDLDIVLEKVAKCDSKVIFSIPFLGDPNLDTDPTHIIKEEKSWWVEKLSEYFKIIDTPKHWIFEPQILVGDKI